jgi:hypothetical protein
MAAASPDELPPVLAIAVEVVPPASEDVPLRLSLEDTAPSRVHGLPPPLTVVPIEPRRRATSPCPSCGKPLQYDATGCPHCGQPSEGEGRAGPSFARYLPRRDLEPHRGGLVLALGVLSVVLLFTCVLCPVSLVLGLAAWVMGRGDLRKMQTHVMDPAGMASTREGYLCGILGTLVGGAVTLLCLVGALR